MKITYLIPLLLVGCSTDPATMESIARANIEMAKVKTLTLECAAGCRAEYTDPRDRGAMMATPTNGNDVAKHLISTVGGALTSVAPYAAVGAVAVEGLKRMQAPQANVTTTTTDSHNTSSTVDSHDTSTTDSHAATTTTTTTDNHSATATPNVTVVTPDPGFAVNH